MRRLLSFILFLCAAIGVYAQTDYGLTVAGTEVTSSNAGDIMIKDIDAEIKSLL